MLFMFLQARIGKAKLQQDEQHQRQADLEQLDNNTIVCSRLITSTSSTNKYFIPSALYKIRHCISKYFIN